MKSKRRIAIAAAAVIVGTTVVVALGWLHWLPSMVRSRVEESAARRGLIASVGGVDLGFSSLRLHDVELSDGEGALQAHAAELVIDAGLGGLVLEGAGAIGQLRLRGVQVQIDVDAAEPEGLLARLRGGESGATSGAGTGRAAQIDGLSVVVRDREGVILELGGGSAVLEGRALRVSAGPVELGPGQEDGLRVDRFGARLERSEEGWKLGFVSVQGAAVRYLERGSEASPLWARVGRHARRLASSTAEPKSPTPAGEEAATEQTGRSLQTGRSFELGPALARVRELVGPRIASAGVFQLERLSVTSTSAEGSHTVLRELDAEIRALDEGRFRLTGAGRPGRGGRLGWRLTVNPDALRAEGRIDFQRLPFVLVTPFLPKLPWHDPEDARLSGELSIEGRGTAGVHLDGQVEVADLALASPRVASRPVRRIGIRVAGQADWDPTTRRLDVSQGSLSLGDASVQLAGSLEWPEEHYLIDVRVTLPPTDCDTAVVAIPADLRAELSGFTLSGRIGGRVSARIDSRDLDAASLDIDVADGCRFITAPALADVRRFAGPFTHRVVEQEGQLFEMETGPGTDNWVPIGDMSTFFIQAVLGHEDGGFFGHHGFSTGAIETALVRNLRAGRYAYGASTITMQLVKNVFLHREKTLARKVQEVLLTWWVESVMTKEAILELYLNVIEYGPGVYGVRNAAEHYFGITAADLGPAQSAYLASILPNPKAYHSYWVQDAVSERFKRRIARFIETLGARERYDAEAVAYGLERLSRLDFHHPGDPRPVPSVHRGTTAPLPFGRSLELQWEEALGPDGTEDGAAEL